MLTLTIPQRLKEFWLLEALEAKKQHLAAGNLCQQSAELLDHDQYQPAAVVALYAWSHVAWQKRHGALAMDFRQVRS